MMLSWPTSFSLQVQLGSTAQALEGWTDSHTAELVRPESKPPAAILAAAGFADHTDGVYLQCTY